MGSMIPATTSVFKSSIGTELCDMVPREGVTSNSVLNSEGYLCLPIKKSSRIITSSTSPSVRVEKLLLNSSDSLLNVGEVQQIDGVKLKDALHLLINIIDKDDNGILYGAMFSCNGMFLHLTHIVTATALNKGFYKDRITLESVGTLTLFPFKEGRKRFYSKDKDEALAPVLLSVLQALDESVILPKVTSKRTVSDMSIHIDIHRGNYSNGISIDTSTNLDRDTEVVIPIQFVSDGLLVPYYGIILSKGGNGNSYKSRQVGLICTGNIRASLDGRSNDYNDTCTGDHPNNMFSSLYSLNIMNYNSMFHKTLLCNGWETQIYISHTISSLVYKQMLGVALEEPTAPTDIPQDVLDTFSGGSVDVNGVAYKLGTVADLTRLFKGRYAIHIPSKEVVSIISRSQDSVVVTTTSGETTVNANTLISLIKI